MNLATLDHGILDCCRHIRLCMDIAGNVVDLNSAQENPFPNIAIVDLSLIAAQDLAVSSASPCYNIPHTFVGIVQRSVGHDLYEGYGTCHAPAARN